MSVINDMLRDLDKRRGRDIQKSYQLFDGVTPIEDARDARQAWLIKIVFSAGVSCLILFALYLGLRWQVTERALLQQTLHKARAVPQEIVSAQVVSQQKQTLSQATQTHEVHQLPKKIVMKKELVVLSPMAKVQQRYARAKVLLENGEAIRAIGLLQKNTQVQSQHYASRQLLARVLVRQGQRSKAEAILREGLRIAPQHIPFVEALAHLYVDKKNYQQALAIMSTVHPSLLKEPKFYAFVAAIYEHLGEYARAVPLYKQLLKIDPSNGIWWLGFAISLEGLGARDSALVAYKRAQQVMSLKPQLQAYIRRRVNALES